MLEGPGNVPHSLRALSRHERVRQLDDGRWALTPKGVTEAERLLAERGLGQ